MIVILISIVLIITAITYSSPRSKGKRGEKKVSDILSRLSRDYYLFNDLVFETERGTTQIDHLVVSKYGLFTIETKNYRGTIYGNDDRQEWTQIIETDVTYKSNHKTYTYITKEHFYNPVKQSIGHAIVIRKKMAGFPYSPVVPIVVFVGKTDISHVESSNHVIGPTQLLDVILSYRRVYLMDTEVEHIVGLIRNENKRKLINNRTHSRNVKKIKDRERKIVSEGRCPRCGGNLVHREGKYGSFLGCSNYPKCKYTHR